MKKSLLLTCSMLAASLLCAKHDGWYVNKLTENYKTPHLTWDKTMQPLNVLFFIQPTGARDVIELAQRMNIKYTPFITEQYYTYASTSVYRAALSGTSAFEKNEDIRTKAAQDLDVIFIGNAPFTKAPADIQFQILLKVQNGTGLIINATRLPYKKLTAKPLPLPAFLQEVQFPADQKFLKAYQFGKGRVLVIRNTNPAAPALNRTYSNVTNRAKALQENEYVFFTRAMQWAAGKDISTGKVEDKGSYLSAPDGAQYRLRNEFNAILAQGTVKNGKIPLKEYGNGKFFCDIIVKGKACSVFAFERQSPLGNTKLEVASKHLRGKIPFNGSFSLEKPSALPLTLTLTLKDAPYGRIWEIKKLPIAAGQKKVDFEFKKYRMPTEAGHLYATVTDAKGQILANADLTMFFPSAVLPEYYQATFGIAASINMANQLVDNLGFGLALGYGNSEAASLKNLQMISYLIRVNLSKNPDNSSNLQILGATPEAKEAKKVKDMGFYNPVMREKWEKYVLKRLEPIVSYYPILYSLGDENGCNQYAGFGPSDLPAFRAFLKKKYGTIANLNANWKTAYRDFNTVPHRTIAASLKDKNYPEWNDHIMYMEQQFADIHHVSAALIKSKDPQAKVGLEGTFGNHDIEQMMEKLDWWGPYTNMLEDQVLRSLYPNVPRFVWSGYHGERAMKAPLMSRQLLLGSVNGNGWYATATDFNHDILAVDQSPSFCKTFMDELQRLRMGLGRTLVANPMFDSKIGIYWSHISRRSPKVDPRCIAPETGIAPIIHFCNQTGAGFEFVTARTAKERLPKMKVLFMCGINAMSDKEAAAILDYVKKGGVVIADFAPARLNENLAVRKNNPLAALFGNQTLLEPYNYVVKPLSIPGFKASNALLDPKGKLMQVKTYGKGKVILTNFNFGIVMTSADKATPFNGFLRNLLTKHGAVIPYSQTNQNSLFRVRTGKDFTLLGVYENKDNSKTVITLPAAKYIYETGIGFIGRQAKITTAFSQAVPLRVYAAFDKKQAAPAVVNAPAAVKAGEDIVFRCKNLPVGRTIVIRVYAPDGKELLGRSIIAGTNRKGEYRFATPYNAVKGNYKFVIMDHITGLKAIKTVTVK
ncbi:MAG: beta-galactosidase [Lentisphaeria bacterium]|nr:beta-galactosidase [Lentisphaeria bacterium]